MWWLRRGLVVVLPVEAGRWETGVESRSGMTRPGRKETGFFTCLRGGVLARLGCLDLWEDFFTRLLLLQVGRVP